MYTGQYLFIISKMKHHGFLQQCFTLDAPANRIYMKNTNKFRLLSDNFYLKELNILITFLIFGLLPFQSEAKDLVELSFEELANIQVTSVSKHSESLSEAAASIFVITNQDIQRSGATNLPEALRLAPNLQVAQDNARNYAVTARGFNSVFENKLLVLIDGRTVYTPLFSGVFWDAQDVVLEDIDRIEVISGAGATLWGANAVNGVINIITKNSSETKGGLFSISGSNTERYGAIRYGDLLNNGGSFRVYGKHADRDDNDNVATGLSLNDGFRRDKVGFRADTENGNNKFTVQGDFYDGYLEQTGTNDIQISGANLLARMNTVLTDGSNFNLQAYIDYTYRNQPAAYIENLTTADIEFKHDLKLGQIHHFVWGGGYRTGYDRLNNDVAFAFLPASKNLHWGNIFGQDEIALSDSLKLILGLKLEHNNYTGMEVLPNARLAWKLSDKQFAWGSISRSVRAPSRIDTDFFAPSNPPVVGGVPQYFVGGGPNFQSEIAKTYEVGYRSSPTPKTTISVTGFYTEYEELRTFEPNLTGPGLIFDNNASGYSRGLEMWAGWQALDNLKFSGGFVVQKVTINTPPSDLLQPSGLGINDPSSHSLLRISYDLKPNHLLDATIRHVNKLSTPEVPSYTAFDLRYGWKVNRNLELSIVGQNLFDPKHAEFSNPASRPEYDRTVFAKAQWYFR